MPVMTAPGYSGSREQFTEGPDQAEDGVEELLDAGRHASLFN